MAVLLLVCWACGVLCMSLPPSHFSPTVVPCPQRLVLSNTGTRRLPPELSALQSLTFLTLSKCIQMGLQVGCPVQLLVS